MLKINFFIGFFLVTACLSAQTPATVTEHGYRFYHHIQKGGQKPKRGESMRAYVNVFIGDSLLSSSRKSLGGTYKFDIAPEEAVLDFYPPLMEAGLLMGIGDSATIFQPLDSSMRKYVPAEVQHIKELRFEIALAQIVTKADKAKADAASAARTAALKQMVQTKVQEYVAGTLNMPLTITKSGLKIHIVEKGLGKPVTEGEAVQVHFFGFVANGTCFDNSFERRQALVFNAGVGQMMPGFDEGIMSLPHGSKAFLFIPNSLAYGDSEAAGGLIPPGAEIIFYIELL